MTSLESFLDRLQTTNTLDEVQRLVFGLRDDYAVEHAIYHVVGHTGNEYGALTYDPGWVHHYIENQYYRIDPVVTEGLRSHGPIDWRGLDWSSRAARGLIGEAMSEGVGKQGYSIPIRGADGQIALFSATSYDRDTQWDRFGSQNLNDLVLAGYYIHQRAAQIMGTGVERPITALSPRERDVLTLLAVGRSRAEAAETLQISEHTLRVYIDSARLKLGARNTVHAVACAMTRGLILP